MICVHCGEATTTDPCRACDRCPLLDHRYRLEWVLGRSPRGITWRGTRVADGLAVAIKRVPVRPDDADGGANREIAILRQLAHPRIPAYLDRVVGRVDGQRAAFLVQSFVGGRTLAAEMVDRRHREEEVLALVLELAAVLTYLHDLRPRVVHGKVEPTNIIRRAGDGALVLVDFGAVDGGCADAPPARLHGTYGFDAPERYRGEVGPASDLYALGMTAAVLLTRQPVEVVGERGWRPFVEVHPETAALLDGLLAPDPRQRFDDARRVIAWTHRSIAAIERDRRAQALLPCTLPMIGDGLHPPTLAEPAPTTPIATFLPDDDGVARGVTVLVWAMTALMGLWLLLR